MVNTEGYEKRPNEIQNTPTISTTLDASHIICGQIPEQPGWTSDQIHVKGNLIFESPYLPPSSYEIVSEDTSCSVVCNASSNIEINTQILDINAYTSNQYFIVYGQAKGEANAYEQFHTEYPDPEIGEPDFNLRMFGFDDFELWFDNDEYNKPDNAFIMKDGNCFRLEYNQNYMVEIEIVWELRYTFDGAEPSCFSCVGLYNRDTNEIMPQSLTWYTLNDIKHKYVTFRTCFKMRSDQGEYAYFPFFMEEDGGSNELTNTEISALCRSEISFKFYEFIEY